MKVIIQVVTVEAALYTIKQANKDSYHIEKEGWNEKIQVAINGLDYPVARWEFHTTSDDGNPVINHRETPIWSIPNPNDITEARILQTVHYSKSGNKTSPVKSSAQLLILKPIYSYPSNYFLVVDMRQVETSDIEPINSWLIADWLIRMNASFKVEIFDDELSKNVLSNYIGRHSPMYPVFNEPKKAAQQVMRFKRKLIDFQQSENIKEDSFLGTVFPIFSFTDFGNFLKALAIN